VTNFSDETLMAYADGELDATTRAAVEAAMAADPAVAQRVARHLELRRRLSGAFVSVLEEPVPGRLLAAARALPSAPPVTPARRAPVPRRSWLEWGALAATLVLGVLLGAWWLQRPGGDLGLRDGQLIAAGQLAQSLSQQLASTQPRDARLRVGISFRSRAGSYCRTFVLRDPSELAGLACREPDGWRIRVFEAVAAAHGTYRQAGSGLPPPVVAAVDELIEGEPLDARAEAAARDRGWSR